MEKRSPESWTRKAASTAPGASPIPVNLHQTPSDYVDLFRFRWVWMVAAVVLGAVASQIAVRFVPEQFVSQTVVLVESGNIPKNFLPQLDTEEAGSRLRTIHEEILARPRIERILEELNPYPEMIDVPRADIVDMIRRRASIGLRGNDAFVVRYTDTDPVRAQKMATRLASMFIEETSGDRARQVQGANEFIDSQLIETKMELEKVEGALRLIKQRYMGMLPNQLEANLSTLQRLELERQSVSEQIRAAKERRGLLERQLALQSQMNEPEAQLIPDLPVSSSAGGPPASGSLPALKAYLAQLQTRYTEQHPEVVATKARIERLESELAATAAAEADPSGESSGAVADAAPAPASPDFLVSDLTAQVAAVDRDITLLQDRYNEIQGHIGRYQTRVEKIPEVEQELQSLERDYALISRYYSELLSRKLEAETAGAVERRWQEEHFKILDPAQVAESPEFPKPSMFLLIGTLAGLVAGVALGFLLEVVDPSVKNLRELESLLPYPVLLTLPHLKEPGSRFRRRRRGDPSPPAPTTTEDTGERRLSAAS
jgi:polysaccharide chain length determinant protein (PEP-CTERM system associated)